MAGPNRTKAMSLIFSGSVSSLSLFLQEMDVDRMHDDVKTEALAAEVWDGWCRLLGYILLTA